ncbi:vascular endothelial growth factor receptor 1-like isoform X3 [Linepithema humile]|uniref:vascular endothelial growth factor receptor 1-like isoform X3 n=1 Tax=Linepithema humile TaxID=83485 RepID=UPI00351DBA99
MKMLLRYIRLHSLVFVIIFALSQVSEGTKPIISPNQDTFIDEGKPLEITCNGSTPIKFISPYGSEKVVNTSTPNGFYVYTFQRQNAVFNNTGWYGCTNYNVSITLNSYNDPKVNWIYVYVKSNTHFFVETDNDITLTTVVGNDITIPCRPTSPELQPILYNDDDMIKKPYNPKTGFTMQNLTVKDSGWYKCLIEKDNKSQDIHYILSVNRKEILPVPKINDESLHHITRGENLYVNCTVVVDTSMRYEFNWITPQEDSNRTSTKQFRENYDKNILLTCQLTILNVTDEDAAGEYECFIKSTYDTKRTTRKITIYDPQIKYINLTLQDTNRHYERNKGSDVQWVVYIDAYPTAYLQWFNTKGKEITKDSKYSVDTTSLRTVLKISSLDITDTGIYMLKAKNAHTIEKLNFTLHVMAEPYPALERTASYYTPNTNAEFHCKVLSFPPPNITWSFWKCPNYPSFENSTIVQLTDVTPSVTSNIEFISRIKMLIEMSGRITCKACNDRGCDNSTASILVSDGVGAFGIIKPKEPMTAGDNIELTCAASIYNYTHDLTWTNQTQAPFVKTERLNIIQHKTSFTYRSTIKINNVQKSDAQDYICNGKSRDMISNTFSEIKYKLVVHDPLRPYFNKTNMNETKVRHIDLIADGHKTVKLQCFVDGMPKPTVTWYKDNILLEENDQYYFMYNHQELNIKYLKQNDSGKYSCQATNRLDTIKTFQEITIKNTKWQKLDIVLAVSIAVLGIVLVILTIFVTIKICREKRMKRELMEAGLTHFVEGALECLNPDLTIDDQAELLPYDKKWEFPRERLKLGKQLGSGAFGVVMKAEAQGICENKSVTIVAVKMVRRTTDPTYVRALASELKIMVHLGKHLNVVNLLGACTKNISKRELLVIVEYCCFGNLHNYLLKHRTNFINQIDLKTGKLDPTIGIDILTRTESVSSNNSLSINSSTDTTVQYCPETNHDSEDISFSPDGYILSDNSSQPGWKSNYRGDYKDQNLKPICTQDLLSWAFQVARGMEYLSQRKVLHGDLAARNILLAENNIVKICDFGLAKSMYKDDNYKKKGDGPLPIKWMAIESIRDRIFSTQSDVWSFGIVLWEFFTLAKTPYPGMEAEKQYQKLVEGYRMEQPEYAIREVYCIMCQCWNAEPTLRPNFTNLVESIGNLLEENIRSYYISLNTPYMDMNAMILKDGKNDYLTMMSAPDHAALSSPDHDYMNTPESAPDSSYLCMSPSCQTDESGIFSPRPHQSHSHFNFPSLPSDSKDAVELSPMLKREKDPYLKPIDVQAQRAEFAQQRQTMKNQISDTSIDRDSDYCNAPRNLLYLNDANVNELAGQVNADKMDVRKTDYAPNIIHTQNNYINMPKQKSDLIKDMPDGFSNPSYVMINNCEMEQRA